MSMLAPSLDVPSGVLSQLRLVDSFMMRLQSSADVVCGAVGGPLVVGFLTPQRNAMTLAAKDSTSSFKALYGKVFSSGFVKGFRGGSRPVLAAARGCTARGPVFHHLQRHVDSIAVSMLGASFVESLLTFSAQKRNAQVQFNATRLCASERLVYQPLHHLVAPGFSWHVGRNIFAMMGIRLISPHSHNLICRLPGSSHLPEESKLILADLASSVVAATLSMPFNHIFSWSACTPELDSMSWAKRTEHTFGSLVGTYQRQGMRLLGRDLLIRINYTGWLFTGYSLIERNLMAWSSSN